MTQGVAGTQGPGITLLHAHQSSLFGACLHYPLHHTLPTTRSNLMAAGAGMSNLTLHGLHVLLRAQRHFLHMCWSFGHWTQHSIHWYRTHAQRVKSFSNSTLHQLRIDYQRFGTWAALSCYPHRGFLACCLHVEEVCVFLRGTRHTVQHRLQSFNDELLWELWARTLGGGPARRPILSCPHRT